MSKIKLEDRTKLLILELLHDECEQIYEETNDPGERAEKAFTYLTQLVPIDGIFEVTPRDWFGYGVYIGVFFGYREKGDLDNEYEPENDE